MTDWSQWQPGWAAAADSVERVGVDHIRAMADAIGVPIADLTFEDQRSLVGLLDGALRAGSSVDEFERAIRPFFGDRKRSYSTADTLLAWAMTSETLATLMANGCSAGWLAEDDAAQLASPTEPRGPLNPAIRFRPVTLRRPRTRCADAVSSR
jgi:hypothetical protein